MSATTNPELLIMPLARDGEKNTLPETTGATTGEFSQQYGFQQINSTPLTAGGKAPDRKDMNGVFNLLGGINFFAQKGWTFHYDSTQDYYLGCVVIDPADGKRYECIADMPAGTVAPHEDTDGDYWRRFTLGDGVPIATILAYSSNGDLPSGYLLCDGSAVSRTMFPDLFAAIGTTYGSGDGSTTFNLPDYNTAARFAQGGTVAGTVKAAGLPNITGSDNIQQASLSSAAGESYDRGAFVQKVASASNYRTNVITGSGGYAVSHTFDASRSSSIYGNSDTVQPPALTTRYIIKAFDGQTADSALIDITQYANELAGKANRALDNLTQAGQDSFLERDFTIIYPNGGSEESPAMITINARYVESNPFPGYYVTCDTEILCNGQWGSVSDFIYYNGGYGAKATQLNDDNIVLQTGAAAITTQSLSCGNPFALEDNGNITTAPCRVKIWKIGKIPT
jgi:microcystin-dependent protein